MVLEEGEGRRSFGYVSTFLLLAWVVALATGGFVDIIHYGLMAFRSLPYLALCLNLLSTLVYIWMVLPVLAEYSEAPGPLAAVMDFLFLTSLAFAGYLGFFYLFIVTAASVASDSEYAPRLIGLFFLVILGGITVLGYGPIAASHNIEAEPLTEPIEVYGVYRLIPLYTAHVYASDRIQIPTHTVFKSDSYIYYNGTRSIYNWIIEPEGFINSFIRKPKGVVFVYGDAYPPEVVMVERELKYGLHNRYFKLFYIDSLGRQVKLHALGFKVLLDENVEIYVDGHVYIVVPVVSWKRGVLYSMPVPHAFAVVNEDGDIEILTIREALSDPRLSGVPKVPEYVAREWARLYRYNAGFIQYYFTHNRYEIRDVGENKQPYLTVSANGSLYWTFVVEPAGETYSVKYIIYVPINATEPALLMYEPKEPLIGISKVISYVKQAHPNYDWNELVVAEPIPSVVNNTIYWKVTVITQDYRGLVSIDLVDARTSQVKSYRPAQEGGVGPSITGEYLLETMKARVPSRPEEKPATGIEAEIQRIKEAINQTIETLKELYKQLEELERLVQNQTATR